MVVFEVIKLGKGMAGDELERVSGVDTRYEWVDSIVEIGTSQASDNKLGHAFIGVGSGLTEWLAQYSQLVGPREQRSRKG